MILLWKFRSAHRVAVLAPWDSVPALRAWGSHCDPPALRAWHCVPVLTPCDFVTVLRTCYFVAVLRTYHSVVVLTPWDFVTVLRTWYYVPVLCPDTACQRSAPVTSSQFYEPDTACQLFEHEFFGMGT